MRSPDLDVERPDACRPRATLPLPTAITSPSIGFSLAVSGMMMPPLVFSSFVDALDDDAVGERTDFHGLESSAEPALAGLGRMEAAGDWHSPGASASARGR